MMPQGFRFGRKIPPYDKQRFRRLLLQFLGLSTLVLQVIVTCIILGEIRRFGMDFGTVYYTDGEQLAKHWSEMNRALWEGDTILRGDEHRKKVKRIRMVLSYCDEQLDWVYDFVGDIPIYSITIYSKCGRNDIYKYGLADRLVAITNVVRWKNVGRCDHSFAHWIESNMADIHRLDQIAFLKGLRENTNQKGLSLRSLGDMLEISQEKGFGCGMAPSYDDTATAHFPGSKSIYHYTPLLYQFNMTHYSRLERDSNNDFTSPHEDLGTWIRSLGTELPFPITPVCYGGTFVASGASIRTKDSSFWSRLEQSLSRGNNIEEGHFAERTWAGLLSKPLRSDQISALTAYTTYIDTKEMFLYYMGMLVHYDYDKFPDKGPITVARHHSLAEE